MEIMEKLLYLVVIIGIAGFVIFMSSGLNKVSVEDVQFDEITEIDNTGFTLRGTIQLKNPSRIAVPVEKIEYSVAFKDSKEIIGTGSIDEFVLEKNTKTTVPITQHVQWKPSLLQGSKLLDNKEVPIIIEGTAFVGSGATYELQFSKELDLRQYIEAVINNNYNKFTRTISDWVT